MNNNIIHKVTICVALLLMPFLIFGQQMDWETTEKVYVKTFQELSLAKAQNIIKLNKKAYIISNAELSKIGTESFQYISPIWQNKQGSDKYAIDNSIILYKVNTTLSVLINENNINSNITSIDSISGNPLIYVLSLRDISYEQIDSLCAVLMAKSYCKIAEPNYVFFNALQDDISPDPINNPYYENQWGLYNGTYPQYDINARNAWRISTGEGIKVAVIDVGFELTHPDLFNNIDYSYDCTDGNDGSVNGAYVLTIDSHGTQCAGVVAATNNNIGVVGVAPDSKLILLRRGYTVISGGDTTFLAYTSWHINALRTAYLLGADVISNSWSLNAPSNDSNIFDEVLLEANTLGRSGKGSVVVFSTGNQYKTFINYPSNSPYTISVGAMSHTGYRCSFSNYGENLDIVAPGYHIWTTQIIPYGSYCYSSGTSFAAPMVSGVAALMLSINPDLTSSEVGNIIRTTAYKLPSYDFSETKACGSWNNNVGYGLIDAEACVVTAAGGYIQGPDYVCDTAKYYLLHPLQQGETVSWSVHNGVVASPSYSIIGATNQDTVTVVKTTMGTVIRNENTTDQESNTIDMLPPFPIDTKQKIKAIIHRSNYSDTCVKIFRNPINRGVPAVTSSNNAPTWMSGTSRTFTVTNCQTVPDSAFSWTFALSVNTNPQGGGTPTITTTTGTGRTITYTPIATTGICILTITVSNTATECVNGDTTLYYRIGHKNGLIKSIDDDDLNITIVEEDEDSQPTLASLNVNSTYVLELWHSIYGEMRERRARSANETMNIAGLPTGTYALVLKENGNIIAQTKVFIP